MQSVVSFDQGGEWVPLQKPANSKCDATAKDPDKVNKIKYRVKLCYEKAVFKYRSKFMLLRLGLSSSSSSPSFSS